MFSSAFCDNIFVRIYKKISWQNRAKFSHHSQNTSDLGINFTVQIKKLKS